MISRWLADLWPRIDEMSQPYRVSTPLGALWQVPNSAGLVDFTTARELMDIFDRHVTQRRAIELIEKSGEG